MRDYFQYLLGFVKCSPEWVESWIPRAEELKDSAVQEEGQGYVLPFSVKDNKRVAVAVTLGKLKEMPEIGSMFESDLKDEPDGWEADKGWYVIFRTACDRHRHPAEISGGIGLY